ncbi:MAG: hypothetical protein AB1353_00560 [Aquificota bacterium]|jgi:hypothetical protein|nr:hypothetical protein [Aquificaceae bacterium]
MATFEHLKDIHKLLLKLSEKFPEFFPRGFGGVEWIEDKEWVEE